jgi:uracil-DNA glycosylase family 4
MEPISADRRAPDPAQRLADVHDAIVSCDRCPRLRDYCGRVAREKKRAHRADTYWGRPVPGFGDPSARLLLVGLAPAAHGANRTGRVFTGDGTGGSGDFLMSALHRTGFANMASSTHVDDGLQLTDAYIAAAVRCAPPDNKPLPEEIARCLDHLDAEVAALPRVQVVVALGKIGFDAWLRLLRGRGISVSPSPKFAHGAVFELAARQAGGASEAGRASEAGGVPRYLVGCYHPSRQNTNTGVLTARMMEDVFRKARRLVRSRASE